MKTPLNSSTKSLDLNGLPAAEMRAMVAELQQQLVAQETTLKQQLAVQEAAFKQQLSMRDQHILILEELLRLRRAQKFAASSERNQNQLGLFDEAEVQVEAEALAEQLPDDDTHPARDLVKPKTPCRNRSFSPELRRERVEWLLDEAEKAGAARTFFTKVKEALHYVPAQLTVLEYWQEKAVFAQEDGTDKVMAAQGTTHPLGKCQVTPGLIAQVITAKYADGLPLHRQQQMFKRLGHEISRSNMARWLVRLAPLLDPLIEQLRASQNGADYLQADESRMPVLKENGKTVQSDKWMWVTRGGPPGQPSVLFAYDPSRAGSVPVRLLDGFRGILQADGYSGYGQVCRTNGLTRIGCWDHARRKFVEAVKAEPKNAKGKANKVSLANRALGHIRKLYLIERDAEALDDDGRYRLRQAEAIPCLNAFREWLEYYAPRTMKGSKTRRAIDYTLSQWDTLIGYCQRGDLRISNVLAENAIRPFAIGRKNWLFADTSGGAHASATYYSLIETAKANGLEPADYVALVLDRIGEADTPAKLKALLPWNLL